MLWTFALLSTVLWALTVVSGNTLGGVTHGLLPLALALGAVQTFAAPHRSRRMSGALAPGPSVMQARLAIGRSGSKPFVGTRAARPGQSPAPGPLSLGTS